MWLSHVQHVKRASNSWRSSRNICCHRCPSPLTPTACGPLTLQALCWAFCVVLTSSDVWWTSAGLRYSWALEGWKGQEDVAPSWRGLHCHFTDKKYPNKKSMLSALELKDRDSIFGWGMVPSPRFLLWEALAKGRKSTSRGKGCRVDFTYSLWKIWQ